MRLAVRQQYQAKAPCNNESINECKNPNKKITAVDTRGQFEYPYGLSGQARRGRTLRTPPGSRDSNGKETFLGAAGILPGY